MIAQQLYDLSTCLNNEREQLARGLNRLLAYHALRYKYLVDAAPRGFDCVNAQLTLRLHNESTELPEIVAELQHLRTRITNLITELQNV